METVSTTSSIFKGKIPYRKQALLDIEFSGTGNDDKLTVEVVFDDRVLLSQPLSTKTTKLQHNFSDDPSDHELRIVLQGNPTGAMLHIHHICIEGLNMRLTMEDSGECWFGAEQAIPSEYMGQVGYQSLKFTTPIYPWLLQNERKPTYYL